MDKQKEEWRKLDGFSLYRVSSLGRIYRLGRHSIRKNPRGGIFRHYIKGSLLSQTVNPKGYHKVKMIHDETGKPVDRYVHRLVAEAFFGPRENMEVDHRGEKSQNTIYLLEWVTRKENMKRCHEDNPHILDNLKRGTG